jgi:SNF2 family DNA or RNA helicase
VAAAKTGERVLRRDAAAESQLVVVLTELGGQKRPGMRGWAIPRTVFPELTSELLRRGWSLEVPGKLYRPWVRATPAIRSGTDWFSLEGPVEFDGLTVPLPELLRALKAREQMVPLGDGTFGVLPEEWLERLSMLSQLAEVTAGDLRFQRSQASLLASLLPDAASTADDGFQKARAALAGFDRVRAVSAAPGFTGELRPYQCEGLGWLQFLEEFGFGGCLADDMGLGKTVQVLAFLHDRWRRAGPGGAGAALIVVPRSLLANWRDEAARFTPELSLLIHAGTNRGTSPEDLQKNALVITTYGTLRRDVELIAAASFSYVILDEAQAIKNAETGAAKAARAIGAPHRLALTGTPIENHLLEIGSMMEFLNPGFLGRKALLERLREDATDRTLAATLRTALAPFILRRTKASVERQLPSRTEQTILCELDVDQRRRYDDLARHYRALLLERAKGMDRGAERMLTLEALLRLRQAACHPALLDPALAQESSAKLEALLPILAEVVSAGHKALVFSQFTTLLALVRGRLDEEKLSYEYLDGKTVDRAERVARFQEDAGIGIFLISLKAGGMGLNLTAADYVFIMDPWWNPAVEAQAIDRAHRIGQTRPVCAYRLIAAGTVEERILALAANKQELADILLATEAGPLERLSREDLERLLG